MIKTSSLFILKQYFCKKIHYALNAKRCRYWFPFSYYNSKVASLMVFSQDRLANKVIFLYLLSEETQTQHVFYLTANIENTLILRTFFSLYISCHNIFSTLSSQLKRFSTQSSVHLKQKNNTGKLQLWNDFLRQPLGAKNKCWIKNITLLPMNSRFRSCIFLWNLK